MAEYSSERIGPLEGLEPVPEQNLTITDWERHPLDDLVNASDMPAHSADRFRAAVPTIRPRLNRPPCKL